MLIDTVANISTYLGMQIAKVRDPDCEGIILAPCNYGDKINHIEMPHGRERRAESLTEGDQSILRPELWKLIRVARISRKGAIYEASAAAQTFTDGGIGDSEMRLRGLRFAGRRKGEGGTGSDFEHMPGYQELVSKTHQPNLDKATLFKKIRRSANPNAFFGWGSYFLNKDIRELKGEWKYQIKFPSVYWVGGEIAIEIHCDTGRILTKTGCRAQIGIYGPPRGDYKGNKESRVSPWHFGVMGE